MGYIRQLDYQFMDNQVQFKSKGCRIYEDSFLKDEQRHYEHPGHR